MSTPEAVTTSSAVLGAVLIKLRAQKGLKQSDLAEMVGVGTSTWSRVEKGEAELSIDQLRLTAKALGYNAGQIIEIAEAAEEEAIKSGITLRPLGTSAKTLLNVSIATCIPVIGSVLGGVITGAVAEYLKDKTRKNENP